MTKATIREANAKQGIQNDKEIKRRSKGDQKEIKRRSKGDQKEIKRRSNDIFES